MKMLGIFHEIQCCGGILTNLFLERSSRCDVNIITAHPGDSWCAWLPAKQILPNTMETWIDNTHLAINTRAPLPCQKYSGGDEMMQSFSAWHRATPKPSRWETTLNNSRVHWFIIHIHRPSSFPDAPMVHPTFLIHNQVAGETHRFYWAWTTPMTQCCKLAGSWIWKRKLTWSSHKSVSVCSHFHVQCLSEVPDSWAMVQVSRIPGGVIPHHYSSCHRP